jgi:tetratricopeptide (TPR) repeat protein
VTEFLKHDGEMVMSRLDDGLLSKIASITGGHYYRASSSDREIDEIADTLNGFDKNEFSSKIYDRLQERYQIFALIAFLLLLFEFFFAENPGAWTRLRQRVPLEKFFILIVSVLMLGVAPARADVRDHVLKGNKLLKDGDIPAARAEFESARIDAPELPFLPYNIAATYYLEQKFDDAKTSYEQALSLAKDPDMKSKIEYNLGHVLFAQGKRDAAVEKFKECLKLNPNDLDAKYNIEYIKSGKTPKNPPQQQNKKDQGGQGDQKQPDDKNKDKGDKSQEKNGKDEQEKKNEEEKKPGQLSKDDAERILQMMKDQEAQKMKDAQAQKMSQEKPNKKQDENGEDW